MLKQGSEKISKTIKFLHLHSPLKSNNMKNTKIFFLKITVLFILVILLNACCQFCKHCNDCPPEKLPIDTPSQSRITIDSTQKVELADVRDHRISVSQARKYIYDYRQKIRTHADFANLKKIAVGGTINYASLRHGGFKSSFNDIDGIMFYEFIDNGTITTFDNTPMIAITKYSYDTTQIQYYRSNDRQEIYLICDTVKSNYMTVTEEGIENELRNYINITPQAVTTSNYGSIGTKANDFVTFFHDIFGTPNESYPYALFNEENFVSILKQAAGGEAEFSGLRYYFGYDSTATTNKIKIIIFAVKKNGQNVVENSKIFERHWP